MLINGWTVVRRSRLSSMNEIGHGRMDAGETNSSHKKEKKKRTKLSNRRKDMEKNEDRTFRKCNTTLKIKVLMIRNFF